MKVDSYVSDGSWENNGKHILVGDNKQVEKNITAVNFSIIPKRDETKNIIKTAQSV